MFLFLYSNADLQIVMPRKLFILRHLEMHHHNCFSSSILQRWLYPALGTPWYWDWGCGVYLINRAQLYFTHTNKETYGSFAPYSPLEFAFSLSDTLTWVYCLTEHMNLTISHLLHRFFFFLVHHIGNKEVCGKFCAGKVLSLYPAQSQDIIMWWS